MKLLPLKDQNYLERKIIKTIQITFLSVNYSNLFIHFYNTNFFLKQVNFNSIKYKNRINRFNRNPNFDNGSF